MASFWRSFFSGADEIDSKGVESTQLVLHEDPGVAIESVMSELEIFVSPTGNFVVITSDGMKKKSKINAFVGNTSTLVNED